MFTRSKTDLAFDFHKWSTIFLLTAGMETSIQEGSSREESDSNGSVLAMSPRIKPQIFLPLMGFCFSFQFGVLGWTVLVPQYILERLRKASDNVTITTDLCKVNGWVTNCWKCFFWWNTDRHFFFAFVKPANILCLNLGNLEIRSKFFKFPSFVVKPANTFCLNLRNLEIWVYIS